MRPIPYTQVRRNESLNYAEVLLITPFLVMVQQFVPVLATRLGATPMMLGILTSGSALMLATAAAMGGWYLKRAPEGMKSMAMPLVVFRSILIVIPLVLLLPSGQAEALIAVTIFLNFFAGLNNVTFATFLPRFTWPDRLARLVSWRWTALGLGMMVATPAFGAVLDAFAMPANYFVACAIAGVFTVVSSACFLKIKPAAAPPPKAATAGARWGLDELLRHKPASHYLVITFFSNLALNAAAPLITLRLVRELGANDAQVGITAAIYWASLAAGSVLMPALVNRFGNRRLYALSGVGMMIQMILLATAQTIQMAWLSGLFGGFFGVMFQVTQYGLIVDSAPPKQFEDFVSKQSTVMNLSIFAGPLIMSGLVGAGLSIAAGLFICGFGRLFATMAILTQPSGHPAGLPQESAASA